MCLPHDTFVRACILLFRQTMFGKWISNYCAKKKPYGWLLIEVYFKSYELFKFEWAIFIAGLHTLLHISKNVSKINIRPKGFFSSTFDTTLCQLNCVTHGDPFSSFDWLEKEKTQYLIYFHSLWRHNKAIEWSDFFFKCFIFRTIIKII